MNWPRGQESWPGKRFSNYITKLIFSSTVDWKDGISICFPINSYGILVAWAKAGQSLWLYKSQFGFEMQSLDCNNIGCISYNAEFLVALSKKMKLTLPFFKKSSDNINYNYYNCKWFHSSSWCKQISYWRLRYSLYRIGLRIRRHWAYVVIHMLL